MLAHICEQARILGGPVWLQVNKRNERAIGAYLKAGFKIIGKPVFEIGGGFAMDDYLMAKALEQRRVFRDGAGNGGTPHWGRIVGE